MARSVRRPSRGRVVVAQLRNDRPRTLAMLTALAVATAAFTVLTGAADTSRVVANDKVASTGPSAYDILVRPHGTQTGVERTSGEVRPGFLDGVFGGISMKQYAAIKRIPGVEVAAPVAMVGYTLQYVPFSVRIGHVSSQPERQLFKLSVTTTTDRGLSHIPSPPFFEYVTRRPIKLPPRKGSAAAIDAPQEEVEAGGEKIPICGGGQPHYSNPYDASARENDLCETLGAVRKDPTLNNYFVAVPLLIEAIDPSAEAKLDGLNNTIVSGRYLRAKDRVNSVKGTHADLDSPTFPVLVSSRNYLDDTVKVAVQHLSTSAADGVLRHRLDSTDNSSRGTGPVVSTTQIGIGTAYQHLVKQLTGQIDRNVFSPVDGLWRVNPATYEPAAKNAPLTPVPTTISNRAWRSRFQFTGYVGVPADNTDTSYRSIHEHIASNSAVGQVSLPVPIAVGVFDPNKIRPFNPLTHVPLGGYEPPQATPADAQSSAALHGQDLLPNSNLGGYLVQPPQLVTTLAALPALERAHVFSGSLDKNRPISAIRIRVSGAANEGALSRARVNLVAQDIIQRTGLQVDITAGSSPSTRVTDLPAGSFGRPALQVREGWVAKNIAVQILRAVDRKSLLLFILVLVVSGLFVLNATTAAVRSRRQQLGVLACLGWAPRQLFGSVILEQALTGVVAGAVGVAVAVPIAHATSLQVTGQRMVLAVAAATGLAVLAAIPPALAASRSDPLDAVRPAVGRFRARRAVRSVIGLAIRTLVRGRGRSAIAVVALALGIAATVFLLAVTTSFNGQLAGDLLGQAVTIQVRGVDYAAVAVMLGLGVFAVADVLFLNIRERASELAALQATGWSRRQVGRLIADEGVVLGVVGSLLGAAAGVVLITDFTNETVASALPLASVAVGVGVVLGGLAAVVPALTLPRRLATSLAED